MDWQNADNRVPNPLDSLYRYSKIYYFCAVLAMTGIVGLSIWLTALFGKFSLYNPDAAVWYGAKLEGTTTTETLAIDSDSLS